MILEGYTLQDCHCGATQSLMFAEVQYFNEPRFMIVCGNCGHSNNAAKTKENAVHIWNKNSKQVLLG